MYQEYVAKLTNICVDVVIADVINFKNKSKFRTAITLLILNTLRPGENRRHFTDDIFKCIFFNEN